MQLVPTTFLALFLCLLLLLVRDRNQLAVVAFSLPFGAAAAFNLPAFGNSSVIVANFVTAALLALILIQRRRALPKILGAARPYSPGFFLVVFIVIALLVTAVSPRIFAGSIEVVGVARGNKLVASTALVPLKPSTANVTQSLYLLEGVLLFLVIVAICAGRQKGRMLLTALQCVTIAHLGLAAFDALENATGLNVMRSLLRTANYALLDNAVFAGLPRLVGGFPEASVFGYFSVALFAFWLVYWRFGGLARYRYVYLIGTLLAAIFSTSSSAYAALGAFLMIVLPMAAFDIIRRRAPTPSVILVVGALMAAPAAIATFFIALELSPAFYAYIDQIALSKLQSRSGVERAEWNALATNAFFDSYAMGVGLGSVRGSSFIVSLLSTVGLLGAAAFAAFLYKIATVKAPRNNSEYRSLVGGGKAACLAMFLQANVSASNPDLGLLFFVFAATAYACSERRVFRRKSSHPTSTYEPAIAGRF